MKDGVGERGNEENGKLNVSAVYIPKWFIAIIKGCFAKG